MPTARAAIALLTAGMLLAAFTPSQQRRPMLGTVVDADGKALLGAEVVCAFALPGAAAGEAVDVQRATTDERGRFRVDLFACTRYLVWAIGKPADDGSRLTSAAVSAAAGSLLQLRARHRQQPSTLKIEGLDAWREYGPFRVRICPESMQIDTPLIDVVDDAATLPPGPHGQCCIDLLGADGNPLEARPITIAKSEQTLTLQPPQPLTFRVLDGAGKPLAGAAIRQRIYGGWSRGHGFGPYRPVRSVWRNLGSTDDDGRLTAQLPLKEAPFANEGYQSLFFLAEKDGHRSSHSGFTDQVFVDGVEIKRQGVDELRFTLLASEPLQGRIVHGDTGVGDLTVSLIADLRTELKDGNVWRTEQVECRARAAADGVFTLSGLTKLDGASVQLEAAVVHDRWVPEELRRMVPYSPLALHRGPITDKTLQVMLSELRPLKLQLLDLTGGPAAGADVMFLSLQNKADFECDGWTPIGTTDSAGRVAMLMQPGKWLLFARTDRGMVHQHLEIADATNLSLKTEPMPAMRGRVVDADGKPVAGARLTATGASWQGGNGRDQALEHLAGNMNWNWIGNAETDDDGRFVCCFLDLAGMTYQAKFRLDQRDTPEFTIVASEDEQTLVLK